MNSTPETWTTQRILAWTADYFQRKGVDSPRLAAEVLLAHALHCDRVALYMDFQRPLDKDELARYRALVERRAAGEPTQYVVGEREFFGRPFFVDRRVLIPRPETELVVEECLRAMEPGKAVRVLDLCTGSGCIAVTLAAERPEAAVTAVDISPDALEVARRNAERHGVMARIDLRQGDLYEPVGDRAFDVVCANPPYVATASVASLQREIREHEPNVALDGGSDGLDFLRRIVAGAPAHLSPGGLLAVEIAEGQGPEVVALASAAGLSGAVVHRDYAGHDRVVTARQAS